MLSRFGREYHSASVLGMYLVITMVGISVTTAAITGEGIMVAIGAGITVGTVGGTERMMLLLSARFERRVRGQAEGICG